MSGFLGSLINNQLGGSSSPPSSPLSLSGGGTVAWGGNLTFTASGGSGGYTYSIITNNTGGTIGSSSGIYTAGTNSILGATDTIQVADSAHSTATDTAIVQDLTTGLQFWVRADKGVTTSGSNVTGWSDQSGNGFNLSVFGAPTLTSNSGSYGNQNVISTVAASSSLFRGSTPNNAQPVTVIWVGKSTGNSGNLAIAVGDIGSGPFVENNGGTVLLYAGSVLSSSLSIITPAAFYFEINSVSGTSRICRNNWLTGGTTGNAGTHSMNGVGIGTSSDNNGSFQTSADCAEFIIYSHILNNTEQSNMAKYITNRYGFTIT